MFWLQWLNQPACSYPHIANTSHTEKNSKGKRPGTWISAKANVFLVEEQSRLSEGVCGDQVFGSWPWV